MLANTSSAAIDSIHMTTAPGVETGAVSVDRPASPVLAKESPFCARGWSPDPEVAARLPGARVLAFAGIARPEKFFATLRGGGAVLVRTKAFPDHHPYDARDVDALVRQAEAEDLRLVTTEKDWIKVERLVPPSSANDILVLPVRLTFSDEAAVRFMLSAACRVTPSCSHARAASRLSKNCSVSACGSRRWPTLSTATRLK